MKNIQIPKELFLDLCRHHLADIRSPEILRELEEMVDNRRKELLTR